MATDFQPRMETLTEPQRRLWAELADVPDSMVLCGGTAVALHLGHRQSVDFDFVGPHEFDPDVLYHSVSFLRDSRVTHKAASTLTCLVDRDGSVQVSWFGTPRLQLLETPSVVPDNQLKVAALVDLAGMKAAVVQKRAEAKDYLDLDAMLRLGGIDLPTALAAGKAIYGGAFQPEITLRSLCYFGDGDLGTLPREVQDRLAAAVQAVDLERLPQIAVGE